jgi:hypothetical protein
VLAPLILLTFVVFGIGIVLAPCWQLLKAATGREDSEGVDWVTLPMGWHYSVSSAWPCGRS